MEFGNRIEVDPGKLRINEDVFELIEEDTNNLTFGVSKYAECLSRIVGEYANMNYCITKEDKNMNDLERLRTLIKAYPNCAKRYVNEIYGTSASMHRRTRKPITIKDVIFNDPATIVFWSDGTKTVVKCQEGDIFDKEKGLAMAISKKSFGNKGNYYENFKTFCSDEEDGDSEDIPVTLDGAPFTDFAKRVNEVYNFKLDLLNRYIKRDADNCSDEE